MLSAKYEVYTVSLLRAIKWFFLSIGAGFCFGSMINYYYWLCALEGIKQKKRDCNHEKIQNCWEKTKALKNFVEENPCDDKAKKRLKKLVIS